MSKDYDPKDKRSIYNFAKKLVGKTFMDVIEDSLNIEKTGFRLEKYSNKFRKGGLGNLLEEVYFGYKANSNQSADFEDAGIELKVTPYEYTKQGKIRAGERLVITMISYDKPFEEDFYSSHLWSKLKLMLLVYYWRNKEINDKLLYKIGYVELFTPPETDLEIIKQDYEIIKGKIISGKAHELSESDTIYLGACTKGSNAIKSTVSQYYNDEIKARKRAFCLKTSYMNYILNNYILGDIDISEKILKSVDVLKDTTFDEYIINRIKQYQNKSDEELCLMFNRSYNNNKAQWIDLSYRMLGIKSNRAEEFEKANIVLKAIRINENNTIKESMSFPPFKFMDLVNEEFEESTIYNYFEQTRFLFVIWKEADERYHLVDAQIWKMPNYDLEVIVRQGWENIKSVIKNGVEFTRKQTSSGIIIQNNLPKKSDNPIIHIRPHSTKSAYRLDDGTAIGDIKDANVLPNGEFMTTQSFWINNSYIVNQIDYLKNNI